MWDHVKERDREILEKLRHVETISGQDEKKKHSQLTLKMVFEENDFFKPHILQVTLEYASEDQVSLIKGTEIEWKEGIDPTKKKIKKKQKHKKTGEVRTVTKTVDADSFFTIFQNRKIPEPGEVDSDEESERRDKVDEV